MGGACRGERGKSITVRRLGNAVFCLTVEFANILKVRKREGPGKSTRKGKGIVVSKEKKTAPVEKKKDQHLMGAEEKIVEPSLANETGVEMTQVLDGG